METELIQLLKLAQGDRSLNAFSRHANVSPGNLSRIMNGQKPSPEILKKLANKAHNNVSYEQLMIAAGYIDNDSIIENNAQLITPKEHEDIEEVIEELRKKLLNTDNLKFDGKLATKEDIETILDSVKVGIEMAKIKKHRSE